MTYTQQDYDRERAIADKAQAYWQANATHGRNGSSMSAELAAHPDYAACDNAMRGRLERFEIFRDKPERLFAYLSSDCSAVTVWTGDILGTVSMGRPYRSNMGDKRYPFRTRIAGADYSGIGYGGGGMHARLRKVKTPS
jgi:hypothetical protein